MFTMRTELVDNYEHIDNNFEYLIENELQEDDSTDEYKKLYQDFNSQILQQCICRSACNGCIHGGNYVLNEDLKKMVLKDSRKCMDLIYECNDLCKCQMDCENRLVQFGPRTGLKIINSKKESMGFGLLTEEKIPKGGFLCEYSGEVLTKSEALKRNLLNDQLNQMNYIVCLNERSLDEKNLPIQTFIDPSHKGNIGRYMNHSCDPNCFIVSIRVNSLVPKLGIFALNEIQPEEELFYHYGGGQSSKNYEKNLKPCCCGSNICTGFLPNWNYS